MGDALPGLSQKERTMRIAVGSDHAGFRLKEYLRELLAKEGHELRDFGVHDETSMDYPDIARPLASAVAGGEYERGILICGSGIGMSIVANRMRGARAALVSEPLSARMCRLHNDANILCMGGRMIGPEMAAEIARVFLATAFEGGRHARRVKKMEG
jgi:ribose 5-phosphate isomerase B